MCHQPYLLRGMVHSRYSSLLHLIDTRMLQRSLDGSLLHGKCQELPNFVLQQGSDCIGANGIVVVVKISKVFVITAS